MGVKDLWQLLGPIGRRVSVETLEGKTLAIDASIWITQFVKAMRDEDGKMVKNAHILGTLRRILKLLYHRIRPVFVFDGATPLLKIRTVQARRKAQEKQEMSKRVAAQRLFQTRLKQLLSNQRAREPNADGDGGDDMQRHAKEAPIPDGSGVKADSSTAGQYVSSFRPYSSRSNEAREVAEEGGTGSGSIDSSGRQNKSGAVVREVDQAVSMLWSAAPSASSHAGQSSSRNGDAHGGSAVSSHAVSGGFDNGNGHDDEDDDVVNVKWIDGYEDINAKDLLDSDSDIYSDYGGDEDYDDDDDDDEDNDEYGDGDGHGEVTGGVSSEARSGANAASGGRLRPNRRRKRRRVRRSANHDLKWSLPDNFDEINTGVLSSLPSHLRKSLVEDARKKQRINSRSTYLPVAGNPEMYSQTQLANFLKTSKLNRKFEEAQKAADGAFEGRQIAAEGNKKYLMLKTNSTPLKSLPAPTIVDKLAMQQQQQQQQQQQSHLKDEYSDDMNVKSRATAATTIISTTAACASNIEDVLREELGEVSDDSAAPAGGFLVDSDDNHEGRSGHPSSDGCGEGGGCGEGVKEFGSSELGADILSEFRRELQVDQLLESLEEPTSEAAVASRGPLRSKSQKQQEISGGRKREQQQSVAHDDHALSSLEAVANVEGSGDGDATPGGDVGSVSDGEQDVEWQSDDENECVDMHVRDTITDSLRSSTNGKLAECIDITSDRDSDHSEDVVFVGARSVSSSGSKLNADNNTNIKSLNTFKHSPAVDDGIRQYVGKADMGPSSDVLERAVATASNMADWAGRAVRNALKEQLKSRKDQTIATEPKSSPAAAGVRMSNGQSSVYSAMQHHNAPNAIAELKETRQSVAQVPISVEHGDAEQKQQQQQQQVKREETPLQPPQIDQTTRSSAPPLMQAATASVTESAGPALTEEQLVAELELEERYARRQFNAAKRDTEGLTEEMKDDIIRLLKAFSLPYIVAPYEAEAQCAVLEQLNLVEGVVTEDSDALLFGAKTVYKNIFSDRKYVEVYLAEDAKREMGLTRDAMVALAYFLGSDYTDGVGGVGIVNAVEIVQAFFEMPDPAQQQKQQQQQQSDGDATDSAQAVGAAGFDQGNGFDVQSAPQPAVAEKEKAQLEQSTDASLTCLRRFKEWLRGYDFTEEIFPSNKDLDDSSNSEGAVNQKLMDFQRKHRTARSRWTVPDAFPDPQVARAYLHPAADANPSPFRWSIPQRSIVRDFCARQLGWTESQMDSLIDPVLKRYAVRSNQRRIDAHFVTYHDNTRFAKIASDRLREAVVQITGKKVTNLALTGPARTREKKTAQPKNSKRRSCRKKGVEAAEGEEALDASPSIA